MVAWHGQSGMSIAGARGSGTKKLHLGELIRDWPLRAEGLRTPASVGPHLSCTEKPGRGASLIPRKTRKILGESTPIAGTRGRDPAAIGAQRTVILESSGFRPGGPELLAVQDEYTGEGGDLNSLGERPLT